MDKINFVQRIQEYISLHSQEEDFTIGKMCIELGYSRRHVDRIFKSYIGSTVQEYINAVRLTYSAKQLASSTKNVLDIALDNHFISHEGFTRSFSKRFSVTPSQYRSKRLPIPLFVQYPIKNYYALLRYREETNMQNETSLCMVTAKERPERKLIFLPSKHAQDYFSYCEEMGCEWEGLLNSVDEKFDAAALIELPDMMVKEGMSKVAAGIEVPLDYDKEFPNQYQIVILPECTMLYFQSEPYEDEEDFCIAIDNTYKAVGKYKPEQYGYEFAYQIAPSFNFGADKETGAKIAVPVIKRS